MTGLQVALVTVLGGLLIVERKSIAQLMLARPIVAGPLIGALLGDARLGLELGVPLELYFLGATSYGATNPNHETLAAIFASAAAVSANAAMPRGVTLSLALVFLLALAVAWVGKHVESALERWNGALVDRTEGALAHGRVRWATTQLFIGVLGSFLLGATITAFATLFGPVLAQLQASLPAWVERGLSTTWLLLLGLSAALAIRAVKTPRSLLYSGAGALAVAAVYGAALAVR